MKSTLAEQNKSVLQGDVVIALMITLLVQTTVSLLAASVGVLAPAIAEHQGWNLGLIALYAPLLYLAAFSISFVVPWLLTQNGEPIEGLSSRLGDTDQRTR